MDSQLKQRMVGAAVLMAFGVIFIPVLLDGAGQDQQPTAIPAMPKRPVIPKPLALNQTPITLKGTAQTTDTSGTTPRPKTATKTTDDGQPSSTKKTEQKQAIKQVLAGTDTGDLSAWVVQLGSFNHKKNAEQLVKKLQTDGYSVFIEVVSNDAGILHRVRVGPEMTHDKADNTRKRIAKKYAIEGGVMRYRGRESN